jgi:hypothetical protein
MIAATECFLKQTIFPDLERGRPGYDVPHTKAAVFYMRKIINSIPSLFKADTDVLIITMYAHDWGYADLFDHNKQLVFDAIMGQKALHQIYGSEKSKELLKHTIFNYLSVKQKDEIAYLVGVHDQLDIIGGGHLAFVREADTLAMLDVNRARPTVDYDSNLKIVERIETLRIPQFVSPYAVRSAGRLLELRRNYNFPEQVCEIAA